MGNLTSDRSKACFLVSVPPLVLTTRMPTFFFPQVACLGEPSCNVKYRITEKINVMKAIRSARKGFSGQCKDKPINPAALITARVTPVRTII